jgi:P-aminobenzoate N-oxygenase AurF
MVAIAPIDERIGRLSTASLRKVIDPDVDLPGSIGPGMILPKELLSVADLDLDLTEDQWELLAREELASILDAGIRFESMLMAGFGIMLARTSKLVDPRTTYILHEVGEETRHSRLFVRVLGDLKATATNPFTRGIFPYFDRFMMPRIFNHNALFCVLVLTGEEAPDLIQKRSSEHPGTDQFVRELNKYHRMEEARHLSFARMLLPEVWGRAKWGERMFIRHGAPVMMTGTFDSLVHPGVYETIGMHGWKTWHKVRKTRSRMELRAESFRPILAALKGVGAFGRRGRIPRAWRKACLVDVHGEPLPA